MLILSWIPYLPQSPDSGPKHPGGGGNVASCKEVMQGEVVNEDIRFYNKELFKKFVPSANHKL